jgi:hypothetical protein
VLHSTIDKELTALGYINKKHIKKQNLTPKNEPYLNINISSKPPDKCDLLSNELNSLKSKMGSFRKFHREKIGKDIKSFSLNGTSSKFSDQHQFKQVGDVFNIKNIQKTYNTFKRNIEKNRIKEHLKQVVLKYRDPKSRLKTEPDNLSEDEEVLKEYVQMESNKILSSLYSANSLNTIEKLETKETENLYTTINEEGCDGRRSGQETKFETSPIYSPKISHTIAPAKKISKINEEEQINLRMPRMSLFQEKSTINSNFMLELKKQAYYTQNNYIKDLSNSEDAIINNMQTQKKTKFILRSSQKSETPVNNLLNSPKSKMTPIFKFEKNQMNSSKIIKKGFKKIPLKKKEEISKIVMKSEYDFNKVYANEYKRMIEKLNKEQNSNKLINN